MTKTIMMMMRKYRYLPENCGSPSFGDIVDNDFVSVTKHSRWMNFALPEVRSLWPFYVCMCVCACMPGLCDKMLKVLK